MVITVSVLGYVVAGTLFYIGYGYRAYFHSDSATANVLAQAIIDSGKFFVPDWYYVNGGLWVLHKQLFILPWLKLGLPNTLLAHAFSIGCQIIFFLFNVVFLLRVFRGSWIRTAWAIIVMIGPYSWFYAENFIGQGSYLKILTVVIACVASITYLFSIGGLYRFRDWVVGFYLFFISGIYAFNSPEKWIAYISIPGFLVLLAISIARPKVIYRDRIRVLLITAFLGSSFFLGSSLNDRVLQGVLNHEGAIRATLVSLPQAIDQFFKGLHALLDNLGAIWDSGLRLVSLKSVYQLLSFAIMTTAFGAIVVQITKDSFSRSSDILNQCIGIAFLGGFLSLFFMFTISSLQAGNASLSFRYISPYLALVLFYPVLFWERFGRLLRSSVIIGMAMVLMSSWSVYSPPDWKVVSRDRSELVHLMRENNLDFGYAPYWHSHVYTVIAGGNPAIRPIHNSGQPFRHLSRASWYDKYVANGRTFILVPNDSTVLDRTIHDRLAMEPSSVIETPEYSSFGSYKIYVFESNPLLATFGYNLANQGAFRLSDSSLRQCGVYVDDALISNGTAGFLHYGPYVTQQAGQYEAIFSFTKVQSTIEGEEIGFIDVVDRGGTVLLGRMELQQDVLSYSIPFGSEDDIEEMELRVNVTADADVSLTEIKVESDYETGKGLSGRMTPHRGD